MSTVLWLNVVALALFAWACVFKLVPGYALSHHRYELWRLRDQLADDIRHGAFRDQRQPRQVLRLMERSIENLDDMSTLNMLLFRLSARGVPEWSPPWDLAAANPSDRKELERRIESLENVLVKHALLGTPSGWLSMFVMLPIAIAATSVEVLTDRRAIEDRVAGAAVSYHVPKPATKRRKGGGFRVRVVLAKALSSIFGRSSTERAALGLAMTSKRRHPLSQSI